MSIICKNCSAEIEDDSKFCIACGQKVELEPVVEEKETAAETPVIAEEPAVEEVPAAEETPVEEVPAAEETPVEAVPDAEETPVEAVPVAEETPVEAVPAVADAPETVVIAADVQEKKEKKVEKKKEKKPAPKKKVSVLGVICAVLLSIFLVINLVIGIVLTMGLGATKADVDEYAITVGGKAYTIESLDEATKALNDGDTKELLGKIVEAEDSLVVELDGEEYELKLSEDTIQTIDKTVLSQDGISGAVKNVMSTYLKYAFVAILSVLAYIIIIIAIIVMAIIVSLGKSRRAFLVPGIIFAVIGIAALVAFIIGVISPELFGVAIVEALFGVDTIATCALIASAVTSILGVIFVALGATATSKE